MTLELRGGVRAAPVLGRDAEEREALRFVPDPRDRDADPVHVTREATRNQEDGLDSALVTQSSSWPDPWAVAGWALARTTRLRVVAAHRIGTTAPTVAARTLQSLDRLSGGRAGVHLILGSADDDVRRDGDVLDKAGRYERAAEFLDVFERTLTSDAPFDGIGPHFPVRDAWSGVRPAPYDVPAVGGSHPGPPWDAPAVPRGPVDPWSPADDGAVAPPSVVPTPARPEISFAGSSDAGIALAARYADVYGIAVQDPERTRAQIDRVRAAAAAHGRTIRIWANARFVLADDDERAHARAAAIVARAGELHHRVLDLDWIRRVAPDGAPPPSATDVRARARASVASATIGSPETAARAVAALHEIGVDVVQLTTAQETPQDRELRRRLISAARSAAGAPGPRGSWATGAHVPR
ncbi:LLM class flavin-dependent oxidoreductase [Patulibacter sp. NPDC049589]|uniref:LLM class flavin-dependent oxidoreductase n=1 Tax=Patulibacter sp. NPDC049589 TaxID=3154731 RepID=UPI00341DA0D9